MKSFFIVLLMSPDKDWLDYLNQFDLSFNYFQNIPSVTEKYCVIIEPREHPLLIKVIKNGRGKKC